MVGEIREVKPWYKRGWLIFITIIIFACLVTGMVFARNSICSDFQNALNMPMHGSTDFDFGTLQPGIYCTGENGITVFEVGRFAQIACEINSENITNYSLEIEKIQILKIVNGNISESWNLINQSWIVEANWTGVAVRNARISVAVIDIPNKDKEAYVFNTTLKEKNLDTGYEKIHNLYAYTIPAGSRKVWFCPSI